MRVLDTQVFSYRYKFKWLIIKQQKKGKGRLQFRCHRENCTFTFLSLFSCRLQYMKNMPHLQQISEVFLPFLLYNIEIQNDIFFWGGR